MIENQATADESFEPELEGLEGEDPAEKDVAIEKGSHVRSLSLREASQVLGKSMRALERSLTGKWGNRLPDGWHARKEIVNGRDEWRVVPPAEFESERANIQSNYTEPSILDRALSGDIIGTLLHAATGLGTSSVWEKDPQQLAQGNSTDVVQLLRELAITNKALAAEQKSHLEDLKLLSELQASVKLIRANEEERGVLKDELVAAQRDLIELRDKYRLMMNLPWWKKIFLK